MSSTVPSLAQIRASLPPEKNRFDSLWVRLVLRPLSFLVAWVFLRLGFSANQVSYLAVLVSLLAAVLMGTGERNVAIVGAFLFNCFALLDCVDGNIARVRRQASPYGGFMDALGGYVAFACVFPAAGIAAEHAKQQIPFPVMDNLNFIIVGAIAAISNLTMRLVYQHFSNIVGQKTVKPGTFQKNVDNNLGITGLLMPAVLVGTIMQQLHWVVLLYAAFYALAFVVVTVRLIIRVEHLQRESYQGQA